MNPIKLLADGIDSLWLWTYSIIAGWGLTFTVIVVAIVLLLIRTINLQRRIDKLEQRLVHAERDYNLTVNNWKNK
jgi:ABC-type bacteriocin/lantibiotic exporter with double-glycine peptidase domain